MRPHPAGIAGGNRWRKIFMPECFLINLESPSIVISIDVNKTKKEVVMAGISAEEARGVKEKEVQMPNACETCEHKEKGCFEHCEFLPQRMLWEKKNKD